MPSLLLHNGKIRTLDERRPFAKSILIENGRITALDVGVSSREMRGVSAIDLAGNTVLPGFIDSHVHLASDAGFMLAGITPDFDGCNTIERVLELVKRKTSTLAVRQWLLGRRLHKEILFQMTRQMLDDVSNNHPVLLTAHGWHFGIANKLALGLAGIDRETIQPEGGEIRKDEHSEPTGILIQRAMDRMDSTYMPDAAKPPFGIEEYKRAILAGCLELIQFGVTTVHDIVVSPDEVQAYVELFHERRLPLRANLVLRVGWGKQGNSKNPLYGESKISFDSVLNVGMVPPFGNEWLSMTGLKFSIDDKTGKIRIPEEELTARLIEANKVNQRFLIHALSYEGIEIALRAIERALIAHPRQDHRHRIEHSGNANCSVENMKKMKELGLIASLNPGIIYFLGEKDYVARARQEDHIFPIRSLEAQELLTIINSDFGLIPPDPFKAIYFSVVRKTRNGTKVAGSQAVSVESAIKQYTMNAAYAGFEESVKGTIEVGKLADLIVVSDDPVSVDPEEIKNIKVIKTIIDGNIVYDNKS
jgi:predicted amidohydrolase YtcJ